MKNQDYLKKINESIRSYWMNCKSQVVLKKLHKNKVPSFTRHNGNRIARLQGGWRYPKGSHGNKLTCPAIGYKRPIQTRFRRTVDGLLFRVVNNEKQMNVALKPYEVLVFASSLGAKKRQMLLNIALEKNIPVYITKKR